MRLSPCSPACPLGSLVLALVPSISLADRPLSTDSAAAAEACQVEAFHEASRARPREHNTVVATACQAAPGAELSLEAAHFQPVGEARWGLSGAVKWAPESWQATGAHWGVKFSLPLVKGTELGWHTEGATLLGLASWELSPVTALHLNFGWDHKRHEATTDHVARLAFVWTPVDPCLLFAEALHEQRAPARRAVGMRYWLQQDTLGLDLTTIRVRASRGAPGFLQVTLGFGWYGRGLH